MYYGLDFEIERMLRDYAGRERPLSFEAARSLLNLLGSVNYPTLALALESPEDMETVRLAAAQHSCQASTS